MDCHSHKRFSSQCTHVVADRTVTEQLTSDHQRRLQQPSQTGFRLAFTSPPYFLTIVSQETALRVTCVGVFVAYRVHERRNDKEGVVAGGGRVHGCPSGRPKLRSWRKRHTNGRHVLHGHWYICWVRFCLRLLGMYVANKGIIVAHPE